MAFTPLGITVALTFIGLPFVVRSVQPVLETLPREIEEVAATLGADRWQTFRRVILPALTPALVAGVSLSFARAIGEYGSVVFISGNMPGLTEIAPLLIMGKLEQYDYGGATAIAVVMLLLSAVILISAGLLQRRAAQDAQPEHGEHIDVDDHRTRGAEARHRARTTREATRQLGDGRERRRALGPDRRGAGVPVPLSGAAVVRGVPGGVEEGRRRVSHGTQGARAAARA